MLPEWQKKEAILEITTLSLGRKDAAVGSCWPKGPSS